MTGDNCPLPKHTDIFTLGDKIGSGSFSTVYKAVEKKTNNTIAVKSYRMRRKDIGQISRAASEMAFIRFLNHPNIIGYVHADIRKPYMYLAVEYSHFGSLANFMEKTYGLAEVTVQNVMKQLFSALCYIHSMNICHGDVKPENIIVTDIKNCHLVIKLTDFGLADVILTHETANKKAGSFYYMAPELHLGFPSDHTADLFSAGVVMYELLYSQKPFSVKFSREQYITNMRRRMEINYPQFESSFISENCINLMKSLLSYDKQKRLSGEALAKHPFLNIEIVKDEQCHYMRACECLVKGVEYVNAQEFGTGYIEVTEAILHLKIHVNRNRKDKNLYHYTMAKYLDYLRYSRKIEEKLISDRYSGPIEIGTQAEKLRCLLKSTPSLLTGYDMCAVGEMYYIQSQEQGLKLIKDGLNVLFPLMLNEPDGLRKHLLAAKMEQWIKMLESKNQVEEEPAAE